MAPIFVMFATNINETTHTLHDEPGINLVCDELFLWRSCFNALQFIFGVIYKLSLKKNSRVVSVLNTEG